MDLSPRMRKTVNGGYEVRDGAVVPYRPGGVKLSFDISAVCISASPERWQARVTYAGRTLITTGPVADWEKAGRTAQEALETRIVELFAKS